MSTSIKIHIKEHYFPHQQGIALVMVLGLLSLMVMLAVSFAIVMRTERVAAGNYLDTVRANHLVRTALHLAMADIHNLLHIVKRESCSMAGSDLSVSNASLYPNGIQIALNNFTWTNYPIYSSGPLTPTTIGIKDSSGNNIDLTGRDNEVGKIIKHEEKNTRWMVKTKPFFGGNSYPPWVACASYSTNNVNRPISLTNDALNYIPASLISEVSYMDALAQSNYWINIDTVVNGKTTTVGRVALLVANCSGLLDANFVGGKTREYGTDPAEIAIEYLDEINAIDAVAFDSARNTYRTTNGSFETLPGLAAGLAGKAGLPTSWHPSNMFCYSACLENEWVQNSLDVKSGGLVDISGDVLSLTVGPPGKDKIIEAFFKCGLTNAGEAGTAYTNLVDYVDDDSYPGNEGVGNPKDLHTSVDTVPMINEVNFYNTVTIVGSNYNLTSTLTVELWYPFTSANPTPFKFNLDASITPDPAWPDFTPEPISISKSSDITCTPSSFQIITSTSTKSMPVPVSPAPKPTQLTWEETITKAEVTCAGQIVDQFDNPPPSCSITIPIPTTAGVTNISQMSKECVDPRFNWDPNSTNQWGPWTNTSSIDAVNLITKDYWLTNSVEDQVIKVANQRLKSLMELSHLIYSTQPWITIDPPTKHKVYDYFRLEWYPMLRGYVNPNTHITDVLAATFYKVPLGSTNHLTTKAEAEIIANAIISGKTNDIYGNAIGYMTIQQVVDVIWASPVIQSAFTTSEIQALIDNTVKLLNLRQNLFVIIINVQVASGGNFPSNPATQRAVAIVWRDPFRDNFYVRSLIFF